MSEIKKTQSTSVSDNSTLLRKTGSSVLLPQPCVPAWKLNKQIACQNETSKSRIEFDLGCLVLRLRWAANQC